MHSDADDYPSMLWVAIPTAVLVSAYLARKWYQAWRLRVHGIGKGAPGFQTSVKRIRVTPEIAARIRRGEQVSPEEIARAAALQAERDEIGAAPASAPPAQPDKTDTDPVNVNEWLPESIAAPKKRFKGRKK